MPTYGKIVIHYESITLNMIIRILNQSFQDILLDKLRHIKDYIKAYNIDFARGIQPLG